MKYTDNTKPQINLLQYLPDVYKSDVNTILSDMVFNRYFTKDDTTFVSGYVGTQNKNAVVNRQIQEETPHRQAFQLTPTMYTHVGDVDTALSFTKFNQQLELMGVDINRYQQWGNSISFNWVPPINIDMFTNYVDYYWSNTHNNTPQYFTIENKCTKSEFRVNSYKNIIQNRGDKFNIVTFDVYNNAFVIDGNYTSKFPSTSTIYTNDSNVVNFNNKSWVVDHVLYNHQTDQTTIYVTTNLVTTSNISPVSPINGEWWLDTTTTTLKSWNGNAWIPVTNIEATTARLISQVVFNIIGIDFHTNSFLVTNDCHDIFLNGFVFFTKNSNMLLSNFWTTVSSSYNDSNNVTTIVVQENIAILSATPPLTTIVGQLWVNTDTNILSTWTGTIWQHIANRITADISLSEMLTAYEMANMSTCDKSGWDVGLWDDNNIGNILWNTSLMEQITHNSEADWLAVPTNVLEHLALWYNPTTDYLYQYGDIIHPNVFDPNYNPSWNPIIGNFSTILSETTGNMVWDGTKFHTSNQNNPWSTTNDWKHKSGLLSFTGVKRAQVPILEYNSSTELNEWTKNTIPWVYRSRSNTTFASSNIIPSRLELEPIKNYVAVVKDGYWYLYLFHKNSDVLANINLTDTFVYGFKFAIINLVDHNQDIYTVDYSEYRLATSTDPVEIYDSNISYMVTVVKLQELVFNSPTTGDGSSQYHIVPTVTSHQDKWLGYHIHWCADLTNITYTPSTNQKINSLSDIDTITVPTYVSVKNNTAMSSFAPQIGILTLGNTYQEFTVDIATTVTHITLHPNFLYDPLHSHTFATNSSEIRVYINGIRQLGNYTIQYDIGLPSYTAINNINTGQTNTHLANIQYITGITFNSGIIKQGDIVRIDIGSASFEDMGLTTVPIRTIQNDTTFASAVASGTQPVYASIVKYTKTEQLKDRHNQYPLFNIYNILSNELITVSPIFAYKEDATQPVDSNTGRRIIITNNGTEFTFVQYLIDEDNSQLHAYRNTQKLNMGVYWYNPKSNTVQYWNGVSWSQYVDVVVNNIFTIRKIVVSSTDRPELWNIDQSLWFNTTTNTLYKRNANSWISIANVIINETDPSLQTIWRHGLHNEEYIPQYVDKNHNTVSIGSPNGSWEVVNQWKYNPEHSNKKEITYSQLFTHFKSIIDNQQGIPGLSNKGVYAYLQDEYQYNMGGTIKEYNYGFDSLISAININTVSPITVIDFAQEEYNVNLFNIRAIFNSLVYTTFLDTSVDSILNFKSTISTSVITTYEYNDFNAKIYSDTSAYNSTTNVGIRNWISTAPIFGLSGSYLPNLSVVNETAHLIHHDGHRTNITYTNAEIDHLSRKIVAQIDPRSNKAIGYISDTTPPTNINTVLSIFNGYGHNTIVPGIYWYKSGNTPILYRLEMLQATPTPPSIYRNGVMLPLTAMYYNTTEQNVYKMSINGWTMITAIGSGDISPMWKAINFAELLGTTYLDIENSLYAIAKDAVSKFDYDIIINEQPTYNNYRYDRFNYFVSNSNIVNPLQNTQYNNSDPWTWNYISSVVNVPPTNNTVISRSYWQAVYNSWYNTPYPNLEPWKLQGYINKPTWWDSVYAVLDGSRRWLSIMWTNILNGIIPLGYEYPNGIISTGNSVLDGQNIRTYNYVSVNISNNTINNYAPDDLFPPYYSTTDTTNRSIFSNYNQIIAPDADYAFGDQGPTEWNWMVSVQYPYDNIVIAMLMQPVKFFHYAFGPTKTIIDQLYVDNISGKVYNHNDALFHGDVYNTNNVYKVAGLNQWYVNYNRYVGLDTNASFRELWNNWTPKLTYQLDGITDTNSINVYTTNFDIIKSDYTPLLINSGIINDVWLDAFNVTLLSIPPSVLQYNNQSLWKFSVNTLANIPRTISYYGVKSYPFVVDTTTGICAAYEYNIINVDILAHRLYVDGDQTGVFLSNSNITINYSNTSTTNTVISSIYESSLNQTRINVISPVNTNMIHGIIKDSVFNIPWSTGDMVVLSSSKLLPYPLVADTPYYIVRNNTMNINEFKLAETINDSIAGLTIDFTTIGTGEMLVSEISSSFNVLGSQSRSQELWYHYALDTNVIKTTTFPTTIKGMQNLINMIDGISENQSYQGFVLNSADSNDFDPMTGRLVNWQLEIERFIDWAFGIRSLNISINDRYPIIVNTSSNTLQFSDMNPQWVDGSKVMVTSMGTVPSPLYAYTAYYIFSTSTIGEYVLSVSNNKLDTSSYISFNTVGSGFVYLSTYKNQLHFPSFEINPYRNNIWLSTPRGVVANIISGPISDIRINTTTFDQYGRPLTADKINVYRQDLRTHINILPQLSNDIDRYYNNDPYHYIHLGGGHLFVEGYEHFILFNNYTVGGDLLYDPFLGLTVTKINLDYYEKNNHVLRPTMGGYYLHGNDFKRNIEGQSTDLKNIYDTTAAIEYSDISIRARQLLGYRDSLSYLDMLHIKSKSQFMFYRGMIASKGSINSVQAYINNKRFIDAKVDEYWAYQVSTYGDNRPKIWPEVKVFASDNIIDDIKLEFVSKEETIHSLDVIQAQQAGFIICSYNDNTRWNNYPQQLSEINDTLFLDADITSESIILINSFPPSPTLSNNFTYWYDTTTNLLHKWTGNWSTIVSDKIKVDHTTGYVYWKHDTFCDNVRIIQDTISIVPVTYDIISISQSTITISNDQTHLIYTGSLVSIINSTGNNTTTPYRVLTSVYDNINLHTIITINGTLPSTTIDGQISLHVADFNRYTSVVLLENATGSYYPLNSEVVRFSTYVFNNILRIYTINPSKDHNNTVKLIDVKTDNVIQTLSLWHPALGYHYPVAENNIDIKQDINPAQYGYTLNPNNISNVAWNFNEVGTVWLDTSYLVYLPYYDVTIYPNVDDRLTNWGKLSDFGQANVYVWTKSKVPPSQWATLVKSEANDTTIAQQDKATGIVKPELFINTRTQLSGVLDYLTSEIILTNGLVDVNDKIIFSASNTINVDTTNSYYVSTPGTGLTTFQISDIHNTTVTFTQLTTNVSVVGVPVGTSNNGGNYTPIIEYQIQAPIGTVLKDDIVTFTTTGILPDNIVLHTNYIVNTVTIDTSGSYQLFTLKTLLGVDVVIAPVKLDNTNYHETGKGTLTVLIAQRPVILTTGFKSTNWNKLPFIRKHDVVPFITNQSVFPITNPTFTWTILNTDPTWYNGEYVNIYVNGHLKRSNASISITNNNISVATLDETLSVNEYDIIDIVRSFAEVDLTFDPFISDDGTKLTAWKQDYEYTTISLVDNRGNTDTSYYFWVSQSTTISNNFTPMSVLSISDSMTINPDPYFVLQKPLDVPHVLSKTYSYGVLPYNLSTVSYREAIIRKSAQYMSSNDHIIRFTNNLTLRDNIQVNVNNMVKDVHQDWELFRKDQHFNVPKVLWYKLVEAISGTTIPDINGNTTPVPALDRVLYDQINKTDTRFGLEPGQAFVDKDLGLATILNYLNDPTIDFSPIDIGDFFVHYTFDTPTNIQTALIAIYDTFGYINVNKMWFEVLYDALATKNKYKGLFKTSWVAIHGVQYLNVSGIFDE